MVNYAKHPLDYALERVRRAEEHLAEFQREFSFVLEKNAYGCTYDLNPQPPHGAINVRLAKETFAGVRLGTLVGEVCYNLRCAMDYLIYALAELDSGSPQKNTQFPIMDTPQQFIGRGKPMLVGINTTHVAAIERLQPYSGCNWALWLREISNMDKHRQIVPRGGRVGITVHSGLETDLTRIINSFDRTAHHPLTGEEVQVKVHVAGHVAFSDKEPTPGPIQGLPVIETLEEIKTQVANTLRDFEPEFQGRHLTPPVQSK